MLDRRRGDDGDSHKKKVRGFLSFGVKDNRALSASPFQVSVTDLFTFSSLKRSLFFECVCFFLVCSLGHLSVVYGSTIQEKVGFLYTRLQLILYEIQPYKCKKKKRSQ